GMKTGSSYLTPREDVSEEGRDLGNTPSVSATRPPETAPHPLKRAVTIWSVTYGARARQQFTLDREAPQGIIRPAYSTRLPGGSPWLPSPRPPPVVSSTRAAFPHGRWRTFLPRRPIPSGTRFASPALAPSSSGSPSAAASGSSGQR